MTITDTAAAISQRDATERVSKILSEDDAVALYKRAVNNYDAELTWALNQRARLYGWDLTGETAGTLAASIHESFVALVEEHKRAGQPIRELLDSGSVTYEYALKQFNVDKFTAKLDAILECAESNATRTTDAYAAALRSVTAPSGSTEAQLLAEIRAGRVWERLARELDANKSTLDAFAGLLQRLVSADAAEKSVILIEAPSYFTARGMKDAGTQLAQSLDDSDPNLARARARQKSAEKLRVVVKFDYDALAKRVASVPQSYLREPRGAEMKATGYLDPTSVKI